MEVEKIEEGHFGPGSFLEVEKIEEGHSGPGVILIKVEKIDSTRLV